MDKKIKSIKKSNQFSDKNNKSNMFDHPGDKYYLQSIPFWVIVMFILRLLQVKY